MPMSSKWWSDDRPHRHAYELLPGGADYPPKPYAARWSFSYRRCLRLVALAAASLATIAIVAKSFRASPPPPPLYPDPTTLPPELLPPLYGRFHELEMQLPQHQPDYPLAEGRKYFHVNNTVLFSGWGNAMQELLLLHYLTYRSGRSFVFDNYTWNDDGSQWTYNNGKIVPSQIPLSAQIQGPTVGAPIPSDPYAPLAVIHEHFQKECPNPTLISNDEVIGHLGSEATAGQIIDAWAEKLRSMDDPCIEVPRSSKSIFDIFVFGSAERLLDVWPEFSASPMITQLGWSPLIELAFDTNRETISPSTPLEPPLYSRPFTSNGDRYTPLPGLLALHIRRGDFEEHCKSLAHYNATFTGYNTLSELSDRFDEPLPGDEDERAEAYRPHCFPDISEIVAKTEEVRASEAGEGLRRVYVMTNGPAKWIDQLKRALLKKGGWDGVASSRDVAVNKEQKYVEQAVDMLIGQRAQVFVGNGFSSLTGQIVMLRAANGFPVDSSRFF
ncbi:uncharacterized protein C8Q71DRAFT_862489 [Rhodofomes roseus]|uniref:Uncharacterized protein n=1 Tax=Rhodofomes roseus TaxID=34475 RepID=A0ABQ8K2L6_9APHY|nr:uncharacterized protein C8Q71DRAFT_862489 [Rhodofomes roseus]KAH9830478.1 hypothetical protein C8Q71DRAFT_862489 [Rhodofomes roseus]